MARVTRKQTIAASLTESGLGMGEDRYWLNNERKKERVYGEIVLHPLKCSRWTLKCYKMIP